MGRRGNEQKVAGKEYRGCVCGGGGRKEKVSVPQTTKELEGTKTVERVMLSVGDQPKLGTTQALADIHPDHRKKQDTT